MAGVDNKKYVATVGLNFDGLKGKPRVEAGEPVPEGLSDKEIAQLLRDGHIKESRERPKHID